MQWKIQSRHSPCVVKQAVVAGKTEDEALQSFVDLNITEAKERHTKNWKVLVKAIDEWVRRGGLDEVEIEAVEGVAGEVESLPTPAPASDSALVSERPRQVKRNVKVKVEVPASTEAEDEPKLIV